MCVARCREVAQRNRVLAADRANASSAAHLQSRNRARHVASRCGGAKRACHKQRREGKANGVASTRQASYYRKYWFQNWWVADTHADVGAVVELVAQALGCAG